MSELDVTQGSLKPVDTFATIADVPIRPDDQIINPNQVRSGLQRGAQVVPGPDGKPQVLMGSQQAFGNGFYVAKSNTDVITNDDPANFIFNSNQNTFKITKTILGTHTVSIAEVTAQVAFFSFAHNLGYRPKVDGSFINSTDGLTRQLPYTYNNTSTYFSANGGGAVVEIQTIDNTNINCAFYVLDVTGLSWILTDGVLSFKFYCQQETLI